ncbi:MAG: hypothetical protein HYX71_13160 [Opitutae bacterium]|nr:hypothetical protein [Opitutae bacterium]
MKQARLSFLFAPLVILVMVCSAFAAAGPSVKVTVGSNAPVSVSEFSLRQLFTTNTWWSDAQRNYVPLGDGRKIPFASIVAATFTATGVISQENIHEYEIDVAINLNDGKRIESRLGREGATEISLIGKTVGKDFKVNLAEQSGIRVQVLFKSDEALLICTKDSTHRYFGPDWKFCPIDGAPLK